MVPKVLRYEEIDYRGLLNNAGNGGRRISSKIIWTRLRRTRRICAFDASNVGRGAVPWKFKAVSCIQRPPVGIEKRRRTIQVQEICFNNRIRENPPFE